MDKSPRILTFCQAINPATALMVDANLYTVEAGAEYDVVEVIESHTVAGSDGSAVTLNVRKCTGTQAPASGTSVLASTFDLKSTANTPVSKVGANLAALASSRRVKAGERIALDFSGTLTALAGMQVQVVLKPVRFGTYR